MSEYEGANTQATLEGLYKKTYGKKVEKLVPGTGRRGKWSKIKKAVAAKDSKER